MPINNQNSTPLNCKGDKQRITRQSIFGDRLLTTNEVSEITGIPAATFAYWRWTKDSGPSYSKIGRSVRYKRSVIEQWIEDCSTNIASKEVK